MRWIYLSPHLDDAVFSAGGLIYEQTQAGIPVEIWTFMCGDPHLGAKTVYFDYLDCIYRRGKNDDWLYDYIFVPLHEDEVDLPARIAESISTRLEPTDQLVCQLGLGSHVDHVLVRRAVELLQRPLLYYTDIPYLFKTPQELAPNTAGMKANAYTVSEAGLGVWQEAIAAYESQISSLFDSPDHMRSQIQQYWSENNGIPLWSA
jgi:LmbE family N-acetylglucosaminyl deacetylase